MATIIQNLTCFELTINRNNQRYYFDEDLLHGKKVTGIFFLFGSEDHTTKSPLYDNDGYFLSSRDILLDGAFDCFLTAFDKKGKKFISSLDIIPLIRSTDDMWDNQNIRYNRFIELPLNREIDANQTYLTARLHKDNEEIKVLVYVLYETHDISLTNELITGSVSIEIPIVEGRINYVLNEFIDNDLLRGNRIKQIKCGNDHTFSYLYLKCKKNFIENIPMMPLVKADTTKEFWFDNLEIDFDQSYLKYRETHVPQGFTEKITFYF